MPEIETQANIKKNYASYQKEYVKRAQKNYYERNKEHFKEKNKVYRDRIKLKKIFEMQGIDMTTEELKKYTMIYESLKKSNPKLFNENFQNDIDLKK
jgi:hypothetical protein